MRALAMLLLLATALAAHGTEPPHEKLRYDPFRAPMTESGAYPAAAQKGFTPVLKATLVSPTGSMANLGGVMLQVGDTARGYTLVEVREREAVFEREGAQIVLQLEGGERP